MAQAKKVPNRGNSRRKPAKTPQERENQLISAAFDLAEEQILEGTASSQVITHFLKLGSAREALEREKLRSETKLVIAKADAIEDAKERAKVYEEALQAFKRYSSGDGNE